MHFSKKDLDSGYNDILLLPYTFHLISTNLIGNKIIVEN